MMEFVELSKSLSFTETAKRLFITQSTLSKHISEIEMEMGESLLVRSGRSVYLTPAGEVAADGFEKVLDAFEETKKHAALKTKGVDGVVVLGMLYYAMDKYAFPLVDAMKRTYPSIQVKIVSGQPKQLGHMLASGDIDLYLTSVSPYENLKNMEIHKANEESAVAIVWCDSQLAQRESVSWDDLEGMQFITGTESDGNAEDARKMLLEHVVKPGEMATLEQIDMLPMELYNTQRVYVAMSSLGNLRDPSLTAVPIENSEGMFDMDFVYNSRCENPSVPLLLHVWDLVKKTQDIESGIH